MLADSSSTEKSGLMLNSIRGASASNNSITRYSKLDNTGYIYNGRPYGVASGVGLIPNPAIEDSGYHGILQNFTYEEIGWTSTVSCVYNESSALELTEIGLFPTPGGYFAPTGFWANGSLPTGDWFGYPTWAVLANSTIFVLAALADESNEHFMYGTLSGAFIPQLNNIQCEARFTIGLFSVRVDTQAQNITVSLTNSTSASSNTTLTNALPHAAFYQPSYLAQTMTTMYTSSMGSAFAANADNVRMRNNHITATDDDWLTGTAEGLQLLLDHTLGSVGAAQMLLQNQTQQVPARLTMQVLRVGDPRYTYVILGVGGVLLLGAVAEAIRTSWWRELPVLNALDLKSAVVAVAAGRLSDMTEAHDASLRDLTALDKWRGHAADREVGIVRVEQVRGEPRLRLRAERGDKDMKGQSHEGKAGGAAVSLLK
jgi:hypothetical protein